MLILMVKFWGHALSLSWVHRFWTQYWSEWINSWTELFKEQSALQRVFHPWRWSSGNTEEGIQRSDRGFKEVTSYYLRIYHSEFQGKVFGKIPHTLVIPSQLYLATCDFLQTTCTGIHMPFPRCQDTHLAHLLPSQGASREGSHQGSWALAWLSSGSYPVQRDGKFALYLGKLLSKASGNFPLFLIVNFIAQQKNRNAVSHSFLQNR